MEPTERYRRGERIGHGAYKTVYKAVDLLKGMERAWNEIHLDGELDLAKLVSEIDLLNQIHSEQVMEFYESWIDDENMVLVFITELMTSGSLRSFVQKAGKVGESAVANWSHQILLGLEYLHGCDPPIVHRDIKLDNIFFHGTLGKVKIGDLGVATIASGSAKLSVIGTPEFMAPEFYFEHYDSKVDIWAFGLALIEMVTLEYPYSECTNMASVYRHVSQGLKPEALAKVKSPELFEFICSCLEYDVEKRLSAQDLLKHPWIVKKITELADDRKSSNNQFIELVENQHFQRFKKEIGGTAEGWAKFCDSICLPLRRSQTYINVYGPRDSTVPSSRIPPTADFLKKPPAESSVEYSTPTSLTSMDDDHFFTSQSPYTISSMSSSSTFPSTAPINIVQASPRTSRDRIRKRNSAKYLRTEGENGDEGDQNRPQTLATPSSEGLDRRRMSNDFVVTKQGHHVAMRDSWADVVVGNSLSAKSEVPEATISSALSERASTFPPASDTSMGPPPSIGKLRSSKSRPQFSRVDSEDIIFETDRVGSPDAFNQSGTSLTRESSAISEGNDVYETDDDQIISDNSVDLDQGQSSFPESSRHGNSLRRKHFGRAGTTPGSVTSDEMIEDDSDVILPSLSAQSSPRDPAYEDDSPDDLLLSLEGQNGSRDLVTPAKKVKDSRVSISRSVSGDDEIIDNIFPPADSIEQLHVLETVPIPVPVVPASVLSPPTIPVGKEPEDQKKENGYSSDSSDDELLNVTPSVSPKKKSSLQYSNSSSSRSSSEPPAGSPPVARPLSSPLKVARPVSKLELPTEYELKLDLAIPELNLNRCFKFDYKEESDTPESLGSQLIGLLQISPKYKTQVVEQLTVCRENRLQRLLAGSTGSVSSDATSEHDPEDYVIEGEERRRTKFAKDKAVSEHSSPQTRAKLPRRASSSRDVLRNRDHPQTLTTVTNQDLTEQEASLKAAHQAEWAQLEMQRKELQARQAEELRLLSLTKKEEGVQEGHSSSSTHASQSSTASSHTSHASRGGMESPGQRTRRPRSASRPRPRFSVSESVPSIFKEGAESDETSSEEEDAVVELEPENPLRNSLSASVPTYSGLWETDSPSTTSEMLETDSIRMHDQSDANVTSASDYLFSSSTQTDSPLSDPASSLPSADSLPPEMLQHSQFLLLSSPPLRGRVASLPQGERTRPTHSHLHPYRPLSSSPLSNSEGSSRPNNAASQGQASPDAYVNDFLSYSRSSSSMAPTSVSEPSSPSAPLRGSNSFDSSNSYPPSALLSSTSMGGNATLS